MVGRYNLGGYVALLPVVLYLAQLEPHAFARHKTAKSSYVLKHSIPYGPARRYWVAAISAEAALGDADSYWSLAALVFVQVYQA